MTESLGPYDLQSEGAVDFTPWPPEYAERYRTAGYWRGEPLDQLLRASAAAHGPRCALVCGARRWSYSELDQQVDRLVGGLVQQGIQAGDRVVVQLPNIGEFVLTIFALFRLGALPIFALPAHRQTEISYFCALAEAKALVIKDRFSGFDYRTLARNIRPTAPNLTTIVVVGEAEEFLPFEQLITAEPLSVPAPTAAAVAFLQLSGGTTGCPKLIPRTHDDYFYSIRASADICALTPQTVYLCALPVAHNFPMSSPGILGVLYAGGQVVLAPDASPDTAFTLIAQEGVTLTALVPPLVLAWLEAAPHRPSALASLQLLQVGGARLSAETAQRIGPTLGCQLQQVFGMAEGLVNYTRLDDDLEHSIHTQGRPIAPDDEVRVVDDDDHDVPEGHAGHLLTRGPYTIRGYFRAQAHNARAFTADGFYRTGDIVRRLADGYLVVEGRAKDQINRGGDKIAAEEIEHHLLAHPSVLDAAVIAVPDPYLGERSCAFIVPRGTPPRTMDIMRFMRERGLATYKVPDRIEWITRLPKTGVGKIDKRALRAQITEESQSHATTAPVVAL